MYTGAGASDELTSGGCGMGSWVSVSSTLAAVTLQAWVIDHCNCIILILSLVVTSGVESSVVL